MINQQQFEMLKIMLDKDVIDGYEVEDMGRQVLKRLADSLGSISTKALIDSGSKGNSEKSVNKKRKKKPAKEDIEKPEDTDEEKEADE